MSSYTREQVEELATRLDTVEEIGDVSSMLRALQSEVEALRQAMQKIMREADCDDEDCKDAVDYIYQIASRAIDAARSADAGRRE